MNKAQLIALAEEVRIAVESHASLRDVISIISQCPASHARQLQQAYFATFGSDVSVEFTKQYKMQRIESFFDERSLIIVRSVRKLIEQKDYEQLEVLVVLFDQCDVELLVRQYFDWYGDDLREATQFTPFTELWLNQYRFDEADIKRVCQQLNREIQDRNDTFFAAAMSTFSRDNLEQISDFYVQMSQKQLDWALMETLGQIYFLALDSVINKQRAIAMSLSECRERSWGELAFIVSVLHRDMRTKIAEELKQLSEKGVECLYDFDGDVGPVIAIMWGSV